MTQYCRYCSYMCCGDANWCEVKQSTYSDSTIKVPNHCKFFEFNPIDALGENIKGYTPRKHKQKSEDKNQLQMTLFQEKQNETGN